MNRNGNGSWNSSMECESSPAASDYQSTSQKGGSSSDTGSHSSSILVHQNQLASRSNKIEHQEVINSSSHSKHIEHRTNMVLLSTPQFQSTTDITTQKPEPEAHPNQTNNICSNATSGVANKLPKPPTRNHNDASVQHMPRVSTTGNGPNGKTIMGFLYKYANNEVSIVCCCHGSSFSPAQFVEHAGGVDVSHPLRHITMVLPPLE
ncbi:hypothetical protein CDL12_01075 [Handroanthus impetiginosus]|uniref:Ninja-family protein n=1 Tax=Handroanthus impetiginosus TaxID=429701 RepID=A0A2G9I8T9_9LAMI|nr:hypothetical protein CDL12_01075 [Handroanthus impetiginosus]